MKKKCQRQYFIFVLTIISFFGLISGCSFPGIPGENYYPKVLAHGYEETGVEISVLDLNFSQRQYITESRLLYADTYSFCEKKSEIILSALMEMGEELILWKPNANLELLTDGGNRLKNPQWSPDCQLVSVNSLSDHPMALIFDPKNSSLHPALPEINESTINYSWSPDQRFATILIQETDDKGKEPTYDLGIVNLTSSKLDGRIPGAIDDSQSNIVWVDNGESVIYSARKNSNFDIHQYNVLTKEYKVLVHTDYDDRSPILSPDGKRIAYLQSIPGYGLYTLHIVDLNSSAIKNIMDIPSDITSVLWFDDDQIVFSDYIKSINTTKFSLVDIRNNKVTKIAEFKEMFRDAQWFQIQSNK